MTSRPATLITVIAAVALTAFTGSKPAPLLIWNASESVPIGLYRVQPNGELFVTTLVVAIPPEPLASFLADGGYLPRAIPLLKRILALPGQSVCRNALLISVDGIEIGAARERDSHGRTLPVWQGCRVIADGEVFLMNWSEPASLDSRYFGPIPSSAIVGRAEPLWTFGEDRTCRCFASWSQFLCSTKSRALLSSRPTPHPPRRGASIKRSRSNYAASTRLRMAASTTAFSSTLGWRFNCPWGDQPWTS